MPFSKAEKANLQLQDASQSLLDEHTVSDLYLTTSPISAGQPHTPFYSGPPLSQALVVAKKGTGKEVGVRFEHFTLRGT